MWQPQLKGVYCAGVVQACELPVRDARWTEPPNPESQQISPCTCGGSYNSILERAGSLIQRPAPLHPGAHRAQSITGRKAWLANS
jgi:hypothetical protein